MLEITGSAAVGYAEWLWGEDMAGTRTKTLSYRRAVWFSGGEHSLEDYINKAHKKLTRVGDRKFKRGDGQQLKGLLHKIQRGGGCYLHIAAETPGDHASTLSQRAEAKPSCDVTTARPPKGREYMDGDILLYVKGNDVCICSTVLREGAVATFLIDLFNKAKLGADSTKFDLQKVANADRLKMIDAQGVRAIDIRATLYDASTKYIKRKNDAAGSLGVVGKHLQAIFGPDGEPLSENLSVAIQITADDRKKGKVVGAQQMEAIARDLIEDDDDYVIITKKNQRISPTEIFIRERVEIDRLGKSVDRDRAWAALKNFYDQLAATGITAQ